MGVTHLLQDFREGSRINFNELLGRVSFDHSSRRGPITSSLLRSMLNCFRPSSRATYLEEDLETDCGCCCMTFFLSKSVDKRSRN